MTSAPRSRAATIGGILQNTGLPSVITVAALVVGLAALLPLVLSSGATTTAGNVQMLQQQKTEWQARVRELELEVAGLGSLDRIEQEAIRRWKMAPPAEVHYITIDAPPPEAPKLPSRYLPPEAQEQDGGSSFWKEILGWLPLP